MNVEEILTADELECLVAELREVSGRGTEPCSESYPFHYHIFAVSGMKEESEQSEYFCFALPSASGQKVLVSHNRELASGLTKLADELAQYAAATIKPCPGPAEPVMTISTGLPYELSVKSDGQLAPIEEILGSSFPKEIAGFRLGRIHELIGDLTVERAVFYGEFQSAYQRCREQQEGLNGEGGAPGGK